MHVKAAVKEGHEKKRSDPVGRLLDGTKAIIHGRYTRRKKKSVDPRWIRRPVAAWPTCLLRLVQNGKRGTNLSSTPCTLQRWPSWSGVQTLFLLSVQFSGGIISGCFSVSTCGKWINDRNMSLKRRATNPLNLVSPHPLVTNKRAFEHWRCGN